MTSLDKVGLNAKRPRSEVQVGGIGDSNDVDAADKDDTEHDWLIGGGSSKLHDNNECCADKDDEEVGSSASSRLHWNF